MRRLLLAGCATVMASAAFTSSASAGILTASATRCGDPNLTQPFKPWGDNANYFMPPGGGFEGSTDGWALSGGARVVSGNEPWRVRASRDKRAMHLPLGSRLTSPTVCVGLGEPAMRFFVKKNSGLLSTLAVDVEVETSLGLVVTVPIGLIVNDGTWQPGPQVLVIANLLPLLPGDKTPVRLSFTPVLGSWTIDDVYVDPWRMR
jgi:hypothetical protein